MKKYNYKRLTCFPEVKKISPLVDQVFQSKCSLLTNTPIDLKIRKVFAEIVFGFPFFMGIKIGPWEATRRKLSMKNNKI